MSWLHTWAGLLVGWILFAVFLSGTLAYFNGELTLYMQPEVSQSRDRGEAVTTAATWLKENKPDASEWSIFPAGNRGGATRVVWTPPIETPGVKPKRDPERDTAWLDPVTGQQVDVRKTQGGAFFYRLHFDMHYIPREWARLTVGACAMFMFIAILTGIVVHRKIFADFFMMRFNKGQRSWLDAHNVAGVMALPFHIMITFTGFVTLASLYMPWGVAANYKVDDTYFAAAFPQPTAPDPRGVPAPPLDLTAALAAADARWGAAPASVTVFNPTDEGAAVRMFQSLSTKIDSRAEAMLVDREGAPLWTRPEKGPAVQTFGVMIGLHAGRFAETGLRWLHFISGLGGTAMIATGLVLWTVKRKRKQAGAERPHVGMRIVETLNIGTIVGFPLASGAFFLANRLLPHDVNVRPEAEINCFFAVWGLSYLYAAIRPVQRGWTEMLAATAVVFAVLPLISAFTTQRNLVTSTLAGDWTRVGVELVMLVTAAGFAFAATKSAKATDSAKARVSASRTPVEAS